MRSRSLRGPSWARDRDLGGHECEAVVGGGGRPDGGCVYDDVALVGAGCGGPEEWRVGVFGLERGADGDGVDAIGGERDDAIEGPWAFDDQAGVDGSRELARSQEEALLSGVHDGEGCHEPGDEEAEQEEEAERA